MQYGMQLADVDDANVAVLNAADDPLEWTGMGSAETDLAI
jgi:hypothetical protein